ncbi:NYN domain-containing protein [Rhodopila globiformis]|uniref:HTH OST-type domain-containing protein n=1 Tax=Rhodopila globiformis TaxID=1071 RepID=A0A2S6N464_RHOGL|nr:NYN domain-containing protein [Rhodopila globiformis]PPQ29405.1 hypothetical protein CCS01_21545 [Rhodopila globiformis]
MAKAAVTYHFAVLIDADNTSPQIAAGLFAAVAKLGEASVRRIYGPFSGTRLKSWAETLAAYAIVPHQAFANTQGKNASDIALVIDAMDLLHTGRFDGFCLVSSDSDFTRLAARIREQGLAVYGFGTATTPESARQACKQFFDTGTLLPPTAKAAKAKGKRAVKLPLLEPDDPFTVPLQIPAPEPLPAAALPPLPRSVIQPIGAAAGLLEQAVALATGANRWASFNGVVTAIGELAPDFNPKSYGCSKLSLLFTNSDRFTIRRDKKKQIHVRLLPLQDGPPEADDEDLYRCWSQHPGYDDADEIPF